MGAPVFLLGWWIKLLPFEFEVWILSRLLAVSFCFYELRDAPEAWISRVVYPTIRDEPAPFSSWRFSGN